MYKTFKWYEKKHGKKGRNKKMVTHMIYIALVAIVAVGVMLNVISGYEIDKTYFDKQEERFAKHAAQQSLFLDTDEFEQIGGLI